MLFVPSAAIAYFCRGDDIWAAGVFAVLAVTGLSLLLFVARNFAELVAGVLASLILLAILAVCAMIPVVGWIADGLIVLYALASVFASIGMLLPYALKATAIWAVFLIALMPAVFHPIFSPLAIFVLSVGLGAALAKKSGPFDEFLSMMSSVPLLAMAIASLGKLFQSGITMKNAQFRQDVSGYTTRAGMQVGDYTRVVTKPVAVVTTSVNPGAVALGSTTGQAVTDGTDN